MRLLIASLKKELLLLSRDLHSVLVLFLMPVVFVLIMSLALQENFAGQASIGLNGMIKASSNSEHSDFFLDALRGEPFLRFDAHKKTYFTIEITDAFAATVEEELQDQPAITISFSPDLGKRERSLVEASVGQAFALTNANYLAMELGYDETYARRTFLKQGAIAVDAEPSTTIPTATQQNVPAWLVFAMFFVSIPISTTMIAERQQKTLMRLRTLAIPPITLYFAKLFPYFLVNYIQLGLMLLIGVFVLPLFGGEALNLSVSIVGLLLICGSVSIVALGFAALIATISKSNEQATIYSGVGSIIFGALGGVMVPAFVMPAAMQKLTLISPMGWGLQGFLDVILRNGSVIDVLPESAVLVALGLVFLIISMLLFKVQQENG